MTGLKLYSTLSDRLIGCYDIEHHQYIYIYIVLAYTTDHSIVGEQERQLKKAWSDKEKGRKPKEKACTSGFGSLL